MLFLMRGRGTAKVRIDTEKGYARVLVNEQEMPNCTEIKVTAGVDDIMRLQVNTFLQVGDELEFDAVVELGIEPMISGPFDLEIIDTEPGKRVVKIRPIENA